VRADYVLLRNALKNDYLAATPADFESTYFTLPIDDTWVADQNNLSELQNPNPAWRARVVATIGGIAVPDYFFFDLARTPIEHGVTIDDLVLRWATLADQLPDEYKPDAAQSFINGAAKKFRQDLAELAKHDQQLREFSSWDEGVVLLSLKLLAQQGFNPPGLEARDYVEITTADYDRFLEKNFQIAAPHHEAQGTGGGASNPTWQPMFVR
jgi:hypothetical protein